MRASYGNKITTMSIVTANVDSLLAAQTIVKGWDADIVCLQETRVLKRSQRALTLAFAKGEVRRKCVWSKPLPATQANSAVSLHGGTLVAAGGRVSASREPLPERVVDEARFLDCFVDLGPGRRLQVFNIYGCPRNRPGHLEVTNGLLCMALERWVRAGSGPAVLVGDLNVSSGEVSFFEKAWALGWIDAAATTAGWEGCGGPANTYRPGTDKASRIDFCLVSPTAARALRGCRVVEDAGLANHVPLRAEFEWELKERWVATSEAPSRVPYGILDCQEVEWMAEQRGTEQTLRDLSGSLSQRLCDWSAECEELLVDTAVGLELLDGDRRRFVGRLGNNVVKWRKEVSTFQPQGSPRRGVEDFTALEVRTHSHRSPFRNPRQALLRSEARPSSVEHRKNTDWA